MIRLLCLAAFVLFSIPAQAQDMDRYPGWHESKAPRTWNDRRGRREVPYRSNRASAEGRAGCPPRAWCGCWLARHLGINNRSLWLARNWASVGAPANKRAGAIAVWRHHVGKVLDVAGDRIRLLSGNDGGAVRDRWRSARGVIAWRTL